MPVVLAIVIIAGALAGQDFLQNPAFPHVVITGERIERPTRPIAPRPLPKHKRVYVTHEALD